MPKYLILLCSKKHFSTLVQRSLNQSLFSTSLTNCLCSFKHVPNIKILSKYTITSRMQIKSPNMLFIMLQKVAGALEKPKYMTVASKRPCLVINAVFHSSSLMQTLLYPHLKSILVKIEALLSDSIKSAILGIGQQFLMVILSQMATY